jgi:hypothetical protein
MQVSTQLDDDMVHTQIAGRTEGKRQHHMQKIANDAISMQSSNIVSAPERGCCEVSALCN